MLPLYGILRSVVSWLIGFIISFKNASFYEEANVIELSWAF